MANDFDKVSSSLGGAEADSARIDKLEAKVRHLSLISEALWIILRDKTGLTDEQLHKVIHAVEEHRKQRKDSKQNCHQCGMELPINKTKCIYCGAELDITNNVSPFDLHP